MGFEYQKPKSASKVIVTKGKRLDQLVLSTMKVCSDIVGVTLGPGGMPVMIERPEHGLPPTVTKDGVTVFRSLGMEDPVAHSIIEAARDASVRTANEAGDGTTTATVISEALVRYANAYCKANPHVASQKIARKLEAVFKSEIEPLIRSLSIPADLTSDEGRKLLRNVARISANGDELLADAVMECFDIVGDDGNVAITALSGPSGYEIERISGYAVSTGFEDSCAKYATKFINDPGRQMCVLEKPVFVVYHGRITEIQTIVNLMMKIGTAWGSGDYDHHNVVVVATGFSESVLGQLALNFAEATTINVFPLLAPLSPVPNSQLHFLEDVCAITGAKMFDQINHPLENAELGDLGPGVSLFEAGRTRANIVGHAEGDVLGEDGEPIGTYEDELTMRVDDLKTMAANAESDLDLRLINERIGKLTGGIAKLKVIGASNGELKEKSDRAEDAVCAVRGAIKYGCLPGGGWTLLKIISALDSSDSIVREVLKPALMEPVGRLLTNCGFNDEEIKQALVPVLEGIASGQTVVYDCFNHKHVDPVEGGLLDSTPAVLEAVRNSISIASLLGTLGGAVVQLRDFQLDRKEAHDTQQWLRDANINEANERA